MKTSRAEILAEYGPYPDAPDVAGVTYDGRNVWFASGDRLNALDPETGTLVRTIPVAAHAGTAYDGRHIFQIAEDRIAPVVMLTAFSQRELIDRARDAGAMAYVVKPFDASDVVPAIELAMARFAEIRSLDDEVADLEERLATRKAVDQAKGILQEGLGLSEAEAFRWIQKTAMDLRKPMREVAEGVIDHRKSGGKPTAKKARASEE